MSRNLTENVGVYLARQMFIMTFDMDDGSRKVRVDHLAKAIKCSAGMLWSKMEDAPHLVADKDYGEWSTSSFPGWVDAPDGTFPIMDARYIDVRCVFEVLCMFDPREYHRTSQAHMIKHHIMRNVGLVAGRTGFFVQLPAGTYEQ